MTKVIAYSFGTYQETSDGKVFSKMAFGRYDGDAQAENQARTIMAENAMSSIVVRRSGVEWSVR